MLEELLGQNEGKTLEFKESTTNLKGIIKSIVAFANTAGGVILIGVRNHSKEIIGLENPLLEEEKIANAVADSISPLMIASIEMTSYRNKELLVIRIPHLAGPYFLKQDGEVHGTYIRLGSTNRKADSETIKTLRLFASNISFDELPSLRGSIDDLYLKETFQSINKAPTRKQCQTLGIYSDHFGEVKPSIGGILLFSHEHTEIFPDSLIRCVYFKGSTKEQIVSHIDISAPLPSAVEEIVSFVEKHSTKKALIGKTKRVDISEYPPEALRELVVNALVHADYSMKGSQIQVALFIDRIEITSPGGLPFGQTMEKALAGYSRLRNHVIGRVFRELKYIEQWGSGLQRIRVICKKLGLKPPKFEDQDNHFRATLYSTKESHERYSREEQMLINYLLKHHTIQTSKAAKLWKLSDRAARTRLTKMLKEGMITRISTSLKDPHAVYVLPNVHNHNHGMHNSK